MRFIETGQAKVNTMGIDEKRFYYIFEGTLDNLRQLNPT